MHEVVDAGEDQPLPAAEPADERVVEGAWLGFPPGHMRGRSGDDPLALAKLTDELESVRVRAGDARDDG